MKKNSYLNIIVFCTLIVGLSVANLLNPNKLMNTNVENKPIEDAPRFTISSFFSGEFTRQFEEYFADNFIFRDKYISLSKKALALKGINMEDKVEIVAYAGANVTQEANKDGDTSNEGAVQDSEWGKIFIYNNAAMEINTYSEPAAKAYANTINAYADRFPECNVYSILVPTQIEYIDDEKYKSISVPQQETIKATQKFFNDSVIPVDIYDNLGKHSDEYIFFRTDHHWTGLGAFYGYQAFTKVFGSEYPSLKDYTKKVYKKDEFLGSLYRVTKNEKLINTPDIVETYTPKTAHKYVNLGDEAIPYDDGNMFFEEWIKDEFKYAIFIGGDQPLIKLATNNNTGRNILLLKDSYGNAFAPYLIDSADNVVVVDPRMFNGSINKVIEDEGITDIVFMNYALITRWNGFSELYEKILK